jgi:hypothetical protein
MENQVNENQVIEKKKETRGRPKKYENITKEIKKSYQDTFYDIHKGQKKKCEFCNKDVDIFNMSHHVRGFKHKKNKEIFELRNELEKNKTMHSHIEQLVA